jgi:hypothetical protein
LGRSTANVNVRLFAVVTLSVRWITAGKSDNKMDRCEPVDRCEEMARHEQMDRCEQVDQHVQCRRFMLTIFELKQ